MKAFLLIISFVAIGLTAAAQQIDFFNPTTKFEFPLGTPLINHKPNKATYYTKPYKNYSWEKQWYQYNTYDNRALPISSVSYDELNNGLHTTLMSQNADSTRYEYIKWESQAPYDTVAYQLMELDTLGHILYNELTYGRTYDSLKHAQDGFVDVYFYDSFGNVDSSYHKVKNHANKWKETKTIYKYDNEYDAQSRITSSRKFEVDKQNNLILDKATREATWYANNRIDTLKSGNFQGSWTRTTTKHLMGNTNEDYLTESWQGTRWYFFIQSKKLLNGVVRYDSIYDFVNPNDPMIIADSMVMDQKGNLLYQKKSTVQTGSTTGAIYENTIRRAADGSPLEVIFIRKRLDEYENKWERWEFEGQAISTVGFSEKLTTEVQSIGLYPNPVQNSVYLNVESTIDLIGKEYSIKNIQGKTILRSVHSSKRIDISKLKQGIFFYQMEGTTQAEKFLIH